MHILIYTRYWKIGGIERVVKYLVDGLGPRGYSFSIVTEDVPNPDNQLDLGAENPIYFRDLTPFNEAAHDKLKKLILRINPDVAISMGSSRALYKIPRALIDTEIPVIISEHNSPEHIKEAMHGNENFLTGIRDFADIVHVLLDDFTPLTNNENFHVIGNPVNRVDYLSDVSDRDVDDPRGNSIIFASRFDLRQKQPDILVKAFSKIAEKYPLWRLELYGDDWFGGREFIEDLIIGLGLEDRIGVHDFSDDVPTLLRNAQIFAFPSAFEGWGLAATEALSHGVPVVAFADCTGVNQIVRHGENGLLVPGSTSNIDSYAAALEELISNEGLRIKLSAAGPASVEPYAFDEFCGKWDNLLRQAAALRGKNKLLHLSDIERRYFDLIGSGRVFDQAAAQRKKLDVERTKFKKRIKNIRIQMVALERQIVRKGNELDSFNAWILRQTRFVRRLTARRIYAGIARRLRSAFKRIGT